MVIKKTYKVVTTEITKTMSVRFVEALSSKDILGGDFAIYDWPEFKSEVVEFDHVEVVSVIEVK